MADPFQFVTLLLSTLIISAASQERVWLSTTTSTATSTEQSNTEVERNELFNENNSTGPILPKESTPDTGSTAASSDNPITQLEDLVEGVLNKANTTADDESKPRRWMSIAEPQKPVQIQEQNYTQKLEDVPLKQDSHPAATARDSTESDDTELEEDVPMVYETIIRKKSTVIVSITEPLSEDDVSFVNLTGIRNFTGKERRMSGGCLDLSDLNLNGDEVKEVIQRMSTHTFHRLDLSGNAITELPDSVFTPVAFSVRELRLDNNPLRSNGRGLPSALQRGGLFHLSELKELNLSSCGLEDMDFFTPWNSNHLEVVDLSCNRLTTVPTNLQFFHKLKKLLLHGNPITRVSELPFALLWNVQTLSLSDCSISCISGDPFRNMDRLKELSLAGNNLTHISELRLARGCPGLHLYLSGNPWHCSCDILTFVERYHFAIRDLEDIRCGSPRWLEGLRTAYLSKEILSLDTLDGDCTPVPTRIQDSSSLGPHIHHIHHSPLRVDRLQLFSLAAFALAALVTAMHLLCGRRKDKYRRLPDDHDDINYIKIKKTPYFK